MDRTTAAAPVSGTLITRSAEETHAVGRALGAAAEPGTLLALRGPLGAGKTQLAKGVAVGLGVRGVVNSPTFILMNEHPGRLRLFHVDAYRLGDPEEALAAGLLDERQAEGVTVIEWAERLGDWLPAERLDLTIQPGDDADRRALLWTAHGDRHARLAAEAFQR
ncbi:MAG TPA: tRNA (adenosine(37)-N6)-threonylcarbamoyltransferase complex ATPase subunit type 1 TsaE [candidate division Zixibacteria bacterium]|nr:tRNA (adenosine(37)-N6)-threonylcarbamoyltransferase complex ATPase subunit type 1 TsaE [candidate division Zixibacteria bacterium]